MRDQKGNAQVPFYNGASLCGFFCQPEHGLFPVAVEVPCNKAEAAENPIQKHGIPYSQCAHGALNTQNIAKSNPKDNHGENCGIHGELYVVAGAEHIGENKAQRPQHNGGTVVNQYQLVGKLRGFRTKTIDGQQKGESRNNQCVHSGGCTESKGHQLFGVIANLRLI